jgi:hypothetical protein
MILSTIVDGRGDQRINLMCIDQFRLLYTLPQLLRVITLRWLDPRRSIRTAFGKRQRSDRGL